MALHLVGETIDACVAYCELKGLSYELILVNDGSSDGTSQILDELAKEADLVVSAMAD